MGAAAGQRECADDQRPDLAAVPGRGQEDPHPRRSHAGRRPAQRRRGGARGRAGGEARNPRHRVLPLYRPGPEGRARQRGVQREQSRLQGLPRDQEGIPRARPRHRRRARPLHQPRPRRPDAWRDDPQRRERRGAGATVAQPGARRRRRDRALRHDGRPGRPRSATRSTARASSTSRSSPMPPNTPRPSMARSATRSAPRAR